MSFNLLVVDVDFKDITINLSNLARFCFKLPLLLFQPVSVATKQLVSGALMIDCVDIGQNKMHNRS